ncbi:unnamed protein product [Mytilus edulis]|uniref:Uncharacterized protein n=1 Tax=Mytilus edulis TaxID=6550 RepID=A0A8S3SW37_MYTED|nr:unnamed protein product [Mytilus edulis]
MQVGVLTMNGGSHAGWIFDDGWWITCKLDFRRRMVDHMQVGVFDDEWWITCKLDFRRWMVDHMQVGVFDDGWWITCRDVATLIINIRVVICPNFSVRKETVKTEQTKLEDEDEDVLIRFDTF